MQNLLRMVSFTIVGQSILVPYTLGRNGILHLYGICMGKNFLDIVCVLTFMQPSLHSLAQKMICAQQRSTACNLVLDATFRSDGQM